MVIPDQEIVIPDPTAVIPDSKAVIPDLTAVIPDLIRDPVLRRDWIADRVRNDNKLSAMTTSFPQRQPGAVTKTDAQ
jgi:hypothetical protein